MKIPDIIVLGNFVTADLLFVRFPDKVVSIKELPLLLAVVEKQTHLLNCNLCRPGCTLADGDGNVGFLISAVLARWLALLQQISHLSNSQEHFLWQSCALVLLFSPMVSSTSYHSAD